MTTPYDMPAGHPLCRSLSNGWFLDELDDPCAKPQTVIFFTIWACWLGWLAWLAGLAGWFVWLGWAGWPEEAIWREKVLFFITFYDAGANDLPFYCIF